jgi:hypothetical protein
MAKTFNEGKGKAIVSTGLHTDWLVIQHNVNAFADWKTI